MTFCRLTMKILKKTPIPLVWLIVCYLIYFQTSINVSDKIQALAIVTLVFVTIFYAYQTQRLVEEEKKRREAEFGLKLLFEINKPILTILIMLVKSIKQGNLSRDEFSNFAYGLSDKALDYHFLMGGETSTALSNVQNNLIKIKNYRNINEVDKEQKEEILLSIKKAIKLLMNESSAIFMIIKESYDFYIERKISSAKFKKITIKSDPKLEETIEEIFSLENII